MNSESKDTLQKALKNAIDQREFVLFYQPQFNLSTCKFDGIEALIRWQHPEKGLILPEEFIRYAEETDVIVTLGEWALQTACEQNKAWQDQGLLPMRIAVNVSEKQFLQPKFVENVRQILQETKLSPKYLELELSENLIINDEDEKIVHAIQALKKDGVQIALDDFGTGYSSISYLKKIPVDRIKIDRAYIQHIHENDEDAVIVRSIINLAKTMHLQVIAEGVETFKQLQILTSHDCKEAQGYYFSEPLPKEEVEKFLLIYQNRPFNKT